VFWLLSVLRWMLLDGAVIHYLLCLASYDILCLTSIACADQWDAQPCVKRINESLIARGYVTWFDLTNMKGELVSSTASVASNPRIGAVRPYAHHW
jgi:hypothetical protein